MKGTTRGRFLLLGRWGWRGRSDEKEFLYSQCGSRYNTSMRVIKRRVLLDFGETHPQARVPLEHWYQLVRNGEWQNTAAVKTVFGTSVDFVANNRAVFDIKGNDYRLIGEINYRRQVVFIRFLGTHAEYDKVDAETVKIY
jgi:mRNA interferase HigB